MKAGLQSRIGLVLLAMAWRGVPLAFGAEEPEDEDELEEVLVSATRGGNLVRNEAIRVEVVPQEEIQENMTVQPGNLTSLLNELGGVRIQTTAPSLGGAALQIRGLPGRHTLVLQDGLPIFGMQADSFGLLQTPPLDLAHVELIKGVGSALYGASALGGVLNLVSRRPDGESNALLNRTSSGGTDLVAFTSAKFNAGGVTVIAGAHDQSREDVDHDAWADLPGYRRYTLRPRLFWADEARAVFATVGYVNEDRLGGTMPGRSLADGSQVRDGLRTRRLDGGVTFRDEIDAGQSFSARFSGGRNVYTRIFSNDLIDSTQSSGFGEVSYSNHASAHAWLAGLALQYEQLRARLAPAAEYRYVVPGLFAQDEYSPVPALKLAASARIDRHNKYGTFFSPRVSALLRPGEDLSIRFSVGSGFAAPTPLLEKIESTSLARLDTPGTVRVERARNASIDLQWRDDGWEINASAFASRISNLLAIEPSAIYVDRLHLTNESGTRRVEGGELLVHRTVGVLHFIGSTTFLDATEPAPEGGRRAVDRSPKWSGELAALFEKEDRGRIGIELGYTGRQSLQDNPLQSTGKAFFELGALAEIRLGAFSFYANANNLTNVRQSRYGPTLRAAPLPEGLRTLDYWAPVVGRWFNIGIRAKR
jgi:outer membrane receptor for ferrienterochelin and colicins